MLGDVVRVKIQETARGCLPSFQKVVGQVVLIGIGIKRHTVNDEKRLVTSGQ